MTNRTFTMIKPDGFRDGHAGSILKHIEGAGFKLVAMKLTRLSAEKAGEFYEIHKERLSVVQEYWSNLTNIPITQFSKPSLKHSKIRKIYLNNDNYFGSLQIKVRKGTNLNYEILGFIDGLGSAHNVK